MKGSAVLFLFSDIRKLLLVCIFFFVFNMLAIAVPVVPNETVMKGTLKEYCLISSSLLGIKPEQVLHRLVISVEEVEEVKGYPNFFKGKEGQSMTFYSKEKIPSELFGKKIKAIVEYMGDERGSIFWINRIEAVE